MALGIVDMKRKLGQSVILTHIFKLLKRHFLIFHTMYKMQAVKVSSIAKMIPNFSKFPLCDVWDYMDVIWFI